VVLQEKTESMTEDIAGTLIDSQEALEDLALALRREKQIGLDTEFVGERTYVPQLELVQVSGAESTAVIDCRAVASLDPLLEVLNDKRIEKILHAGQQDLELLFALSGRVPAPVFDTQVAAAMIGLGAQPSYASLLERVLQVRIDKTQTLTDWSKRPLTATQIAYAHEDVRYLLPVRERLREKLQALGREDWLREELARLESPSSYQRPTAREAYLRVRGRGGLRSKGLAILRELAAWREEEAQRRNKPRGGVLSDEVLVELARRAPERPDALRNFRGQFARAAERYSSAIIEAVKVALALPHEEWPHAAQTNHAPAPSAGVIELLQAVLRLSSEEAGIAPTMVATSADLHALVDAHALGRHPELPLLSGWRREIAGANLLALLEGKASLRLDPTSQRVRLETS
jgi:ribonuclease D